MSNQYFPARIRQARIARAMSQIELAAQLNVTKGAVSQYETGTISPGALVMRKIATVLGFPIPFFLKPPHAASSASSPTFFRSLKSTPVKHRYACEQKAELMSELVVGRLSEFIEFPSLNVPCIAFQESYSLDDCELLASSLREAWGINEGPIDNLIDALQTNGIIVAQVSMKNEKVDAFSKWYNGTPYIFLSKGKESSVRWRFSLAHELGHLFLHRHHDDLSGGIYDLVENEANMFASAFLLPQESFFQDVSAPSLEHLLYLKRKWKVSVAAMVKKCADHDIFSSEQITSLYRQIAYRGWRRTEPYDDISSNEHPYVLKQAMEIIINNGLLSVDSIENEFLVNPEELANWCYIPYELIAPTTKEKPRELQLKLVKPSK